MGLLLLAVAAAGGTALTFLPDIRMPAPARVAAGTCVGMAVLGLAGLVAGLLAGGLTPLALSLATLGAAAPLALCAVPGCRRRMAAAAAEAVATARRMGIGAVLVRVLVAALLVAGLWRVFDRSFFVDESGLYTADEHNLGDLPFHLAVMNGFTRGENFPPEHPELAGARLTYPFLVDLVSALMVRAGSEWPAAFLAQNLLLGLALVVLVHHMTRSWTGDALAARMAPLLVLLSGGLGFLLFPEDLRRAGLGLWDFLWRLPETYTMRQEAGLRWGNALTTLLITQRSLLMGLPLFVLSATLWWEAVRPGAGAERRPLLAAAGLVTGLLPLVHAHCFVVALGVAACLALLFPSRAWAGYFVAALALALPQVLWMASGSSMQPARFLAWHLGWDRMGRGVLGFWLWNTGVFIPLLAAALLWRKGGRAVPAPLLRLYAPFALLFVVPNLLRLSPWVWDNIKFLFLWYVASVPLVAALLARWWRGGAAACAGAALALAAATLSGALDAWRVAAPARANLIYDAERLAFAEAVAAATPPRALILHAPTYNAPSLLTGRRSLLGYAGHIWSQGLEAGDRERRIALAYGGGALGDALLAQLGVDFAVVGPQERRAFRVDEASFERFELAAATGTHRLYRIR